MNLRVLNVGEGDLKITFDKNNAVERDRAASTIKTLLQQGFAIMVEVGSNEKGPMYQRVTEFDSNTCEYIVMGDAVEQAQSPVQESTPEKKRKGRQTRVRMPMNVPAIATGRSAGGYDPEIRSHIRRGSPLRETI